MKATHMISTECRIIGIWIQLNISSGLESCSFIISISIIISIIITITIINIQAPDTPWHLCNFWVLKLVWGKVSLSPCEAQTRMPIVVISPCWTHTHAHPVARAHPERGHVVWTLIPSNNRMVQSSNPLSVAVAAVRGFWVVGKTPAAPRLFLSHPALDS